MSDDPVALSCSKPLIVEIVDLVGLPDGGAPQGDISAWREFLQAHRALTAKVEADEKALRELTRLITADHELTPDEIRRWLEYAWAHLVNKYQGALAEYFAARELSAWLSNQVAGEKLGAGVRFVPGDAIREPREDAGGNQWLRGADGFLTVEGPGPNDGDPAYLRIAGVVEIKSYPATFARHGRQIEAHIRRLQGGLTIGERHFAAAQILPMWYDKRLGWKEGSGASDWRHVLRLLVSPPGNRASASLPARSATRFHEVFLPIVRPTLAASAYELTAKFLHGVGAKAYAEKRPWPEMTPEEAAANALKEALYHILRENRAGTKRATRIAEKLYNVYGFGYEAAAGQSGMLWVGNNDEPSVVAENPTVADLPPANAPIKELLDGAWHHYREGALAAAVRWAQAALGCNPPVEKQDRLHWLIGMCHFYSAEFQQALSHLPQPKPFSKPDTGWWTKDMLTLARAYARSGQLDSAQARLDAVARENLAWADLPVAVPVVEGWIAYGRGERLRAASALERGLLAIEALRAAHREREEQNLGEPAYFDIRAIQAAIVDAAGLTAALGNPDNALKLILPLSSLFPPLVRLVSSDPVFDSLRNHPETREAFLQWRDTDAT